MLDPLGQAQVHFLFIVQIIEDSGVDLLEIDTPTDRYFSGDIRR